MAVGTREDDERFISWTMVDNLYYDFGPGLEQSAVRFKEFNELRMPVRPKLAEYRLPRAFWTKPDVIARNVMVTVDGVSVPRPARYQRASRGRGRLRHFGTGTEERRPGSNSDKSNSGSRDGASVDGSHRGDAVKRLNGFASGSEARTDAAGPNDEQQARKANTVSDQASTEMDPSCDIKPEWSDHEFKQPLPPQPGQTRMSDPSQLLGNSPAPRDDEFRFSAGSTSASVCSSYGSVDSGRDVTLVHDDVVAASSGADELPVETENSEAPTWPPIWSGNTELEQDRDLFPCQNLANESQLVEPRRPAAPVLGISNTDTTNDLSQDESYLRNSGLVTAGYVTQEYMFNRLSQSHKLSDMIGGILTEKRSTQKKQKQKKKLKLVNSKGEDLESERQNVEPKPEPKLVTSGKSYSQATGFSDMVNDIQGATNGVRSSSSPEKMSRAPVVSATKKYDIVVEGFSIQNPSASNLKEIFEQCGEVANVKISGNPVTARISYYDEANRNWAADMYNEEDIGSGMGVVRVRKDP